MKLFTIITIVALITGCANTTTLRPGGEAAFCDKNPSSSVCIGIMEETVAGLFRDYRYATDSELYGVVDHWAYLVEDDNGFLYGDCENCLITLADRLVERGLPPSEMTLYIVADSPATDHMIMSYGRYFIDCTTKSLMLSVDEYEFLSRRTLTQPRWERYSQHASIR